MSCSIFRNANTNEIEKILAPNGKESILFNSVLNLPEIAGDKEKALKTWAMVYTKPFKEWFGDWEGGKEPVAKTKEGVEELFDSNPELASIGTPEQYSTYLSTIFPESQVKDIVFHVNRDTKVSPQEGKAFYTTSQGSWVYELEEMKGKRKPIVIDVKNPTVVDPYYEFTDRAKMFRENGLGDNYVTPDEMRKPGTDSVVGRDSGQAPSENSYIVYQPSQVHQLGTEEDVERFKKFVAEKTTEGTSTTSNTSKVLDENGEPMLVYHGSPNKFDEFTADPGGNIFFTSDRSMAKKFGERYMKLLYNLKNINVNGKELTGEELEKFKQESVYLKEYPVFIKGKVKIQTNEFEGKTYPEFIVSEANQIKSLFNNGDFSYSNNIYYGINTETELEFHANTLNVISNFLQDIGIEQRLVPEFIGTNGNIVEGAIAAANFMEGTVDIIQDMDKRPSAWDKLPEEAAHWWYRLLKENSPLKKLLWDAHETALKVDELYKGKYGKLEGVTKAEDLTEEAVGQLIAEAIKRIEQKNAAPADYTFLKKFIEWVNSMLAKFKNMFEDVNLFETAAMKILTSDKSDLMTWEEYQKINNLVNFTDVLTEQSVSPFDYTIVEDLGEIDGMNVEIEPTTEGDYPEITYGLFFRKTDGSTSPIFNTQDELDMWMFKTYGKIYNERQEQKIVEVRDNEEFVNRLLNKTYKKQTKFLNKTLDKFISFSGSPEYAYYYGQAYNPSSKVLIEDITEKMTDAQKQQLIASVQYDNIAPTLKILPEVLKKYGVKGALNQEIIQAKLDLTKKRLNNEITKEEAKAEELKLNKKAGGNPISLSEPIKIDGAKKEELTILNYVKDLIKSENPEMKSISAADFVNEVNEYLKMNYLLGFANESQHTGYRINQIFNIKTSNNPGDIQNLTEEEIQNMTFGERQRLADILGLTNQNKDVFHNKVSLRFNDTFFKNSGHPLQVIHFYDAPPSAWGNLTYFYTDSNSPVKDAVLLHEIQNDNIEYLKALSEASQKGGIDDELENYKMDQYMVLDSFINELKGDKIEANLHNVGDFRRKTYLDNQLGDNYIRFRTSDIVENQVKNQGTLPLVTEADINISYRSVMQFFNEQVDLNKNIKEYANSPEKKAKDISDKYAEKRKLQDFYNRGGLKSKLSAEDIKNIKDVIDKINNIEEPTADPFGMQIYNDEIIKSKRKLFYTDPIILALQDMVNNNLKQEYGKDFPIIKFQISAKPVSKTRRRNRVSGPTELNSSVKYMLLHTEKQTIALINKDIKKVKQDWLNTIKKEKSYDFNKKFLNLTKLQFIELQNNYNYNAFIFEKLIEKRAEILKLEEQKKLKSDNVNDNKIKRAQDQLDKNIKEAEKLNEEIKNKLEDSKANVNDILSIEKDYFMPLVHHLIQKHINTVGKGIPMYFSGYDVTMLTQGNDLTASIYAGKDEVRPPVYKYIVESDRSVMWSAEKDSPKYRYNPANGGKYTKTDDTTIDISKSEYDKALAEASKKGLVEMKRQVLEKNKALIRQFVTDTSKPLSAYTAEEVNNLLKNIYNVINTREKQRIQREILDLNDNRPYQTGALYNIMTQVAGVKLIYQEKIKGLRNDAGGYLVDLSNYNFNVPVLYGIEKSKSNSSSDNLAKDRTIYDGLAKESKYKYKLPKESTTIVSDIKLAMRELGVEKNDELAPHEFESLNEQFKEQDMVLLSMNQEDSNNSKVENVVSTNLETIPNDSKIEFIINRLQELVPGVNIKFISPNEIAGIINNPSIKTDRVNAFRRNNTVYLVQGRFNGEMAIEETLHPIVEAIMVEDPTLAADLLFEINELFPEITSDVNETYTNAKGFTNADRQNEIISRGLAGLLNLRLEDNFDKKYKKTKSVIKRAIEYISNLLSKIVSKGKYYLGMKPLSYKVDQVLSMLEEGTLQYAPKVGGKIFFNLSSDQEDMYSYLYSKANEQQREVLEGIIEKNIIHDEDDHTYVDSETGESLQSITSVLKGAADPRFLMRMEFGNDFDFIMNSICLGKNFDVIKTELKHMPEDVAKSFYDEFSVYTRGIRANGSIIVPQLVQADVKSKKAGKLDMLIIDPLGNLYIIDLKTTTSNYSVNSPKYDFKYVIGSQEEIDENIPMEERTTGVGSIFYGQKMSIRQQQGIQQHSYKKMIELKGFFVRGVKTLHYRTLIDDNKIVGFKFDDEVDHTASIYPEVDQIITTEVNYKVTKLKTLEGEQAKPENRQIVAEINDTVDAAVEKLKSKKKYLEGLPGSKKNVLAPPEYIEKIQELITTIELTLSRGNPALAYSELVKFVNSDINDRLEKIRSGSLPASEMLTLLLESEKDFEEYENYVNTPKLRLQNKTLTRLADESLNNIRDFKNIVQEETREYMKTFVSENTSRDLSREDIEDIIKQAEDISRQDYLFGDMATSTDTILAVIDKKYKALLQEVYDKKDEIMRTMTKLGNDLALLTPKSERNEKDMYKFMLKENKDGKTTGYFVRPIGDKYWTMYDNIQKKLKDDEGETKKYIMITNPNTADEVDIKYNQELYKAKQERNEFSKKEKMDKDGNIVDGEYHKYNTEFKEARAKHQDIEYYKDGDGNIVGYSWIRKAGVSDKAYNKFLAKYYTDAVTYLKPVMEKSKTGDRVFRGRVVEESSSFVKSEFVEIREISETGVDMRDEKYIKLMNPVTELDKARTEFYKAWVKNYEEQLDNLSPDVAKKMLNKIPVIQSNFEREIKSKGDGFMKSVLKGMRNLNIFDLKAAPQTAVLDENGNVKPGIPVFYTGDTQNEWKLTNLKAKKATLKAEWKDEKMTTKEYREKVKGIDTAIKIEEGKIKKSQVSNDMVLNIIEFTKMAENFKVMSEFEATVDTALRVLKKERKYTKRDAGGNLIKNAANKSIAKFAGEGALTVSRLEKWMDMVLYRTVDPYNSKLGRFTKKLQSMMSLRSVGLNPFGQMNNYLMGRINNHIESYGGNLFAKRAYYRSVLEYQKDFIPGWFRKKASVLKAKADGSSGYYEIAKPTSKYEAMASYFRMMRKLQSIDGLGTMQDRVFDMAYMMQESAEYNIQTKTGNAVIMTETLTNTKTGEVVSIYDAFDFNSNTGEIKLKDGFEFTSEQKHQITNKIYEVNKQIHGNYAYEDRMVIQESLMGELVAQFHKWIYPMFKQKFQKGYIDENLGEMEGRYYTLWSLTKQVVLLRDAKESWSELSDVQKGNIYKSAAEMSVMLMSYILYSILASLGEDLDDDDELLGFRQKKLLNILTAQSDRLSSEVSTGFNPKEWYRMAKNPAALFGYLGDLMEAVGATGTFITSMGDPEVTRYKKGVHKGDLKLWKEWKDLIPGLYVLNRYDSYETVKTFFIK